MHEKWTTGQTRGWILLHVWPSALDTKGDTSEHEHSLGRSVLLPCSVHRALETAVNLKFVFTSTEKRKRNVIQWPLALFSRMKENRGRVALTSVSGARLWAESECNQRNNSGKWKVDTFRLRRLAIQCFILFGMCQWRPETSSHLWHGRMKWEKCFLSFLCLCE